MKPIHRVFAILILATTLGACTVDTPISSEGSDEVVSPTPKVPTATPTGIPVPTLTPTPISEIGPFRRVAGAPESGKLAVTANGDVYLLGSESAYLLAGDEWVVLFDDAPARLRDVAPNGEIWAADELSILRWNENVWTPFDEQTGWSLPEYGSDFYDRVSDILFASDGSVWVATNQDVRRFDGQRWRVYGFPEMAISSAWLEDPDGLNGLTFVIREINGSIWLGGCKFLPPGPVARGSGLRWFDGVSWRIPDSTVSDGCITAIGQAPDGSVWMDFSKIVTPTDDDPYPPPDQMWIHYDPARATWESHRLPEPEGYNRWAHVLELSFDADSNPWVETELCGGASCYTVPQRYYYNRAADTFVILEYEEVTILTYLIFDRDGVGWLFSHGLYNLIGEEFVLVDDLATASVIQDQNSRIWALAQYGGELGLWATGDG